jgi:hypothetical protein
MQTAEMREKMFTIRMSEEETARLEGLAKHYGLTAAGVIRMLVKRDSDNVEIAKREPPLPKSILDPHDLQEKVKRMMADPITREKYRREDRAQDRAATAWVVEKNRESDEERAKTKKPKK